MMSFERCSWPRKTGSVYKYHMKLRQRISGIKACDLTSIVVSKSPKIQFLQPINRTNYFRNIPKEVIFTYFTRLPFKKKSKVHKHNTDSTWIYVKWSKLKIPFFLLFMPFFPTMCLNSVSLLKRSNPLWVLLITYFGHLSFEHQFK